MSAATAQQPAMRRALLADGKVVLVRPLCAPDAGSVLALHERMSADDTFRRFFSAAPAHLDRMAEKISTQTDDRHAAVGAFLDDQLIGVAHYETLPDMTSAEVAMVIDGAAQAHGVGTLLLEQLVSIARGNGLTQLSALVLSENHAMLAVLGDLGLPVTVSGIGPERSIYIGLGDVERYREAMTTREQRAERASLRHVLAPRSIAVIGASRRVDTVGHQVLRNLLHSGYRGEIRPINPHADHLLGLDCVGSVHDLDPVPELAVVCVPAAAVPEVVEQCGAAGILVVVLLSSGLDVGARERLQAAIARYGMRLVGPNCVGVVNTDESVSMNATFLAARPPVGRVGVMTQSGGVAIALADLLAAAGLGVSTLVSVGDKYDVSGNDLLLWWRGDERTDSVVLYLESFGNPRKFSRIARILSREKPIVTVRSGSTAAAQRAAASHTASAATPAVTRDALFQQAGVIAVNTTTDLVRVLAALDTQPLPGGSRVAVLSNAGGLGVLAADACGRYGLMLPDLNEATVAELRQVLPPQASIANPVDTTATVSPAAFRAALEIVLADESVDAMIVAAVPTALGDPGADLAEMSVPEDKPVLRVCPGQLDAVRRQPEVPGLPLSYPDSDAAASTLGLLAEYARWRREPRGRPAAFDNIDLTAAKAAVHAWLREHPEGGWLDAIDGADLLRHFGIATVPTRCASDMTEAVTAFEELAVPVVLKAVADHVLHKSAAGGVVLDVRDEAAVRATFERFRAAFGDGLRGVLLQPMMPRNLELLAGISSDDVFGPLVVFGLGGVATDLVADRAGRLAPLTDADADRLMWSLRSAEGIFAGQQQRVDAVREVLQRVGVLAELLPEIVEMDLNPIVQTESGYLALDWRIRLREHQGSDAELRYLNH